LADNYRPFVRQSCGPEEDESPQPGSQDVHARDLGSSFNHAEQNEYPVAAPSEGSVVQTQPSQLGPYPSDYQAQPILEHDHPGAQRPQESRDLPIQHGPLDPLDPHHARPDFFPHDHGIGSVNDPGIQPAAEALAALGSAVHDDVGQNGFPVTGFGKSIIRLSTLLTLQVNELLQPTVQHDQAVALRTHESRSLPTPSEPIHVFSAPQAQRGTGEQQPNCAPSADLGMENVVAGAAETLQQLRDGVPPNHPGPNEQDTCSRLKSLIASCIY
jgi:hypothetical protein